MALLDEEKLQRHIYEILQLLRKQVTCCKIVSTTWATSSLLGVVFVTIDESGKISVYDAPGGTLLTPAEYGSLTSP
jgi:hypothetical protein